MIIQENIALTALAGVSGLITAVGVLSVVGRYLGESSTVMGAPSVELSVAVWATVILAILGLVAAIMPARAALKINPIEALRME